MFDELLKKRYSCRNYTDKVVSVDDLNKIVNAGRISPSARNSQPCEYYVIKNEGKLEELRKYLMEPGFNKFAPQVSSFIVLALTKEMYEAKKEGTKRDFTDIDTGIACHAMALEATNLGLATCILGGFNHEGVAKMLEIDDVERVKLVLAVGYSNDDMIPNKDERRKRMVDVVKYL